MKKAVLTLTAVLVLATSAFGGGLDLKFSRCDFTNNYKPVAGNFDQVKPGTRVVVPEWNNAELTVESEVFLWEVRDYRPTVKAHHKGAKGSVYAPVANALYCNE